MRKRIGEWSVVDLACTYGAYGAHGDMEKDDATEMDCRTMLASG